MGLRRRELIGTRFTDWLFFYTYQTGKTQTLVEIIRQLVADGKRVLVCGASNLAVGSPIF